MMGWYDRVGGMGLEDVGGACSQVSGGTRVCVGPGEGQIAGRLGCELLLEGCPDSPDDQLACCPADWYARAQAAAAREERPAAAPPGAPAKALATGWEAAFTHPADLVGEKFEEATAAIGGLASNIATSVAGMVGGVPGAPAFQLPQIPGMPSIPGVTPTRPAPGEPAPEERQAGIVPVGPSRWLPWVIGGTVIVGGIGLIAWLASRDRYSRSSSRSSNPKPYELKKIPGPKHIKVWSVHVPLRGSIGSVLKVGSRWMPTLAGGHHLHRSFSSRWAAGDYLHDVWSGEEAPV